MNLNQLERAIDARKAEIVTIGEMKFGVRRLIGVHFEAARRVGIARSGDEPLPEGLNPEIKEHREAWEILCITQEVILASLEAWPFEDEIEPDLVRRFVRLAPDSMVNKLYAAATPRFSLSEIGGVAAGNA